MPFGRKAGYTRVFEFGVAGSVLRHAERAGLPWGLDEARAQMRARVAFWNRLVEIERAHRERVEQVLREANPSLADLADAAQAEDAPREVVAAYRKARRETFARPEVRARLDALEAERQQAEREATRESGLWWCNSDDVLASYRAARTRPGDLRFHSFRRGEGKLSVRYQTGRPDADLSAPDTRFWVERVSGQRYALAHVRIGSDEDRDPIWLKLPVILHRPLPERAVVRGAAVVREVVASKERWKLLVTVAMPAPEPQPVDGRPTVTVQLRWSHLVSGVLVAEWSDSEGKTGQLILPEDWLRRMSKVEDLQSLRDRHFNAARAALRAWLDQAPGVPDWLREATKTLAQWRSPSRLAWLALTWRHRRFDGDHAGYELVETWRQRDKHLWEYQAHLRDQELRERREIYRVFAADLVQRYGKIVVQELDLRRIARRKRDLPPPARHQRHLVALSTLVLAIRSAASRQGVTYVSQKPRTVQQNGDLRENKEGNGGD